MMLRRTMTIGLVALAVAFALTATGCRAVRIADSPGVQTVTKDVPLGGATAVRADVTMLAGDLTLSSESSGTNAFHGEFTFGDASWNPEVSYAVTDGKGALQVRQPDSLKVPSLGNVTNRWDVKLAGGVPTDLTLTLGLGRGNVDLRGLDVRALEVLCGIGETTLDLSGPRADGVTAKIESGVGNLTIKLPKSVGVRVNGRKDGLGDMRADGFIAQGNTWVNDAYAGTGPKMEIDLTPGVGDMTLLLTD
jgi:hypothetical protein